MLYFDHNATAPLLPAARAVWIEASEKFVGNPSSPHRLGARAEAALTEARAQLAGFLGCDAMDILWTSGATESANLVLHHFACALPADTEVWISALEHPCVLEAAARYFPKRRRLIPANGSGNIDTQWLHTEVRHRPPGLIAVMAANNEIGSLQPWREVLGICRERAIPFFCDAVQWMGKLPARGLGECDFVSGGAHKFGGPRGVGFLKCPAQGRVEPLLVGGPQEDGRRAGTENVPGVLAMLAALEARETLIAAGQQTTRRGWRERFEQQLVQDLPGSQIVGAGVERLWNTVSALMPETDCPQRWLVKLDKLGYAVSTGSACASGREKPSHVLTALRYSASDASRALRFSSGWETTEADWQSLLEGLRLVRSQLTSPIS